MISRQQRQNVINQYVDYGALPLEIHDTVHEALDDFLLLKRPSSSEILRHLAKSIKMDFPGLIGVRTLAKFIRRSPSLVSKVLVDFQTSETQSVVIPTGRPGYLPKENERIIERWLVERVESKHYPTLREFRVRVLEELEAIGSTDVPSSDYYYGLLKRISDSRFAVKFAAPLEEARYMVTPEIISEHFRLLRELEITKIDPELIINMDETGIGQSKCGRTEHVKVIVPAGMKERPTCMVKKVSHYVTSLAAVTASGKLLRPAFITRRGSDHPDGETLSYSDAESGPLRFSTPKAFVSRAVFTDYVRQVVIPYITSVRERLKSPEARAIIIFDGHKSHLLETMAALCADLNIVIYCLPPHSSHLLQPLDKGVFRRFKSQFATMEAPDSYSKISCVLERMWMAHQATEITGLIWNAWHCAGLPVQVRLGKPYAVGLDEDHVQGKSGLNHAFDGNEAAQGRKVSDPWGILNEDELMMAEAGFCPLCGVEKPEIEHVKIPDEWRTFLDPHAPDREMYEEDASMTAAFLDPSMR